MAKASDVVDIEQSLDEPVTSLPEHAGSTGSREDIKQAAYDEAGESADLEATFSTLAEKSGDLTPAELREAAGKLGEGMSDEELQAAWKQAQTGEPAADKTEEQFKLPFPIYDDKGNKIEALDKVDIKALLSGKLQIGYNALGKEQRRALNDILRNASLGHYNEQKMTTLQQERKQVYEELQTLKKEHESWGGDRKLWDKVLGAYVSGNPEPLKQLVQAYAAEMGRLPKEEAPNVQVDREREQAGQQFVLNHIMPAANKLAGEYGADAQEVTNAILGRIQEEPSEFLTREKVDSIINYELPHMLEEAGYAKGGQSIVNGGAENAELKAAMGRIDALEKQLQSQLAESKNAPLNRVKGVVRKVPSAGSGNPAGAGESMPAMKNRNDMKKWLRGETND